MFKIKFYDHFINRYYRYRTITTTISIKSHSISNYTLIFINEPYTQRRPALPTHTHQLIKRALFGITYLVAPIALSSLYIQKYVNKRGVDYCTVTGQETTPAARAPQAIQLIEPLIYPSLFPSRGTRNKSDSELRRRRRRRIIGPRSCTTRGENHAYAHTYFRVGVTMHTRTYVHLI